MKSVMSADRNMVIKYGPHGRFLACPGFPECRNTKPYLRKDRCCLSEMRQGCRPQENKKGTESITDVIDNPECDFMSWQKPSDKKCPVCGSYMIEKGNKLVCSQETCGYVETKTKEED